MDRLAYAVEPGLLYGRPGPARSRWNLPYMKERGLVAVVSLVPLSPPDEVTRAGLAHYSFPFQEKLRLPYKTANGFLWDILDRFDPVLNMHLPKKQPVLVHCNHGQDRTGLLLAYYLITRKGLSARQAIRALRRHCEGALTGNGYEEALLALEPRMLRRKA